MNFLKRLGQIAVQGLQIAVGVAPYAAPIVKLVNPQAGGTVENVARELQAIAGVVQSIEVAAAGASVAGTPVSGPQKLAMAAPLVKQIILSSDMLTKHKIADPVKFQQGVDKVTGGVADILSSLNDHVETTDKA